ncbi:unnamed protein product [Thlaspi arvense]|uniref:Uncharacterized protein n=1 Tax=Thlaspi arvense TaxID=13288 RepID=A0AAU9S8P5_THLAR|nr:unnamed protein product [Thlaspi arvense]
MRFRRRTYAKTSGFVYILNSHFYAAGGLMRYLIVDGFASCLPVEMKKIVVETIETCREPSLKLKSHKAIFHISFRAKGCDYKSVLRRTADGKAAGHILVEINSWDD